jgi:hypothetical protein
MSSLNQCLSEALFRSLWAGPQNITTTTSCMTKNQFSTRKAARRNHRKHMAKLSKANNQACLKTFVDNTFLKNQQMITSLNNHITSMRTTLHCVRWLIHLHISPYSPFKKRYVEWSVLLRDVRMFADNTPKNFRRKLCSYTPVRAPFMRPFLYRDQARFCEQKKFQESLDMILSTVVPISPLILPPPSTPTKRLCRVYYPKSLFHSTSWLKRIHHTLTVTWGVLRRISLTECVLSRSDVDEYAHFSSAVRCEEDQVYNYFKKLGYTHYVEQLVDIELLDTLHQECGHLTVHDRVIQTYTQRLISSGFAQIEAEDLNYACKYYAQRKQRQQFMDRSALNTLRPNQL